MNEVGDKDLLIRNRTFEEMQVGDRACLRRVLSRDDILLFAAVSGDVNPAHVDEEFASSDLFRKIIAHGMWGAALISTVLGTEMPGPGTIYLGQTLRFNKPVSVGDCIETSVMVKEKNEKTGRVTFECLCTNQLGEVVIRGEAEVLAPREKIARPRKVLPEVKIIERFVRFGELIRLAESSPPLATAVVHPVDKVSLQNCVEAKQDGLIEPILIGPELKIRAVAAEADIDLGDYTILPVEHSHAAAETAVRMAAEGAVSLIMKGTLSSDELLSSVKQMEELRTGKTISHVHALDIPTFDRTLFITDTEMNPSQDLKAKVGIVQNAVDLLHALEKETPKVAILSASEFVDLTMPSTVEAAALCKMSERGQIEGAFVDGPMPFDIAVSDEEVQEGSRHSRVSGNAEILIAPDMEAGRILVQQLKRLLDASAAGIVLGLRVPIILPGPRDDVRTCEASCALAAMWTQYTKKQLELKSRAKTLERPLD